MSCPRQAASFARESRSCKAICKPTRVFWCSTISDPSMYALLHISYSLQCTFYLAGTTRQWLVAHKGIAITLGKPNVLALKSLRINASTKWLRELIYDTFRTHKHCKVFMATVSMRSSTSIARVYMYMTVHCNYHQSCYITTIYPLVGIHCRCIAHYALCNVLKSTPTAQVAFEYASNIYTSTKGRRSKSREICR